MNYRKINPLALLLIASAVLSFVLMVFADSSGGMMLAMMMPTLLLIVLFALMFFRGKKLQKQSQEETERLKIMNEKRDLDSYIQAETAALGSMKPGTPIQGLASLNLSSAYLSSLRLDEAQAALDSIDPRTIQQAALIYYSNRLLLALVRGDVGQVERVYAEAYPTFCAVGGQGEKNPQGKCFVDTLVAWYQITKGEYAAAERLLAGNDARYADEGTRRKVSYLKGLVCAATGRAQRAREHFEAVLDSHPFPLWVKLAGDGMASLPAASSSDQ